MKRVSTLAEKGAYLISRCRGGSRIFFRRGCTHLLLYFNTNKPHSFFFFLQNTSCIRKPQVISGGGVHTPCTLPLDPSLRWLGSAASVNRNVESNCLLYLAQLTTSLICLALCFVQTYGVNLQFLLF